jgi:hypothetical protein
MTKSKALFSRYFLLFISIVTITAIACQKDKSEDPPPTKTKKELLANKWKVSDIQDSLGNSLINLPFDEIKCLKDNIYTIVSDDTFIIDESTVVCDPSTAGSGTWTLLESDTKLKFTPTTGNPLTFNLLDVTETTLKVSYYLIEVLPRKPG